MPKAQVIAIRKNHNLVWTFFFFSILLFFLSTTKASAQEITLEPNKESLASGDELVLTVNLDTGTGNETNSYIASLDYPEDKLEFVSIDTSKSPFNMALESKGGEGKVTIMRGTTEAKTGKVLVGTVNFKAKASTPASVVTVNDDSAIIRSSDNTNILPGSTVQNSAPSGKSMEGSGADSAQEKSSGIMGIWEWIKNFFSSLFK